MTKYDKNVETYRSSARRAAKDLCYGQDVIDAIDKAKTEGEIERIMISARKRKFKD